jgi:hypothetical protein
VSSGGPRGTRAKRCDTGTPCMCTTLDCTAANACGHEQQKRRRIGINDTARHQVRNCPAMLPVNMLQGLYHERQHAHTREANSHNKTCTHFNSYKHTSRNSFRGKASVGVS